VCLVGLPDNLQTIKTSFLAKGEPLVSSPAFVRKSVVKVVFLEDPLTCEEVWGTNFESATLGLS